MSLDIVILAAGAGNRLRSATAKPLIAMAGKPLLAYVLTAAESVSPRRLAVVHAPSSGVEEFVGEHHQRIICVPQPKPLGTADALRRAIPVLGKNGQTLVLCADTPLLTAATLRRLHKAAQAKNIALLTFIADQPKGYGRIVRDDGKRVARIVEERDADSAVRKINEVYGGCLIAPTRWLSKALPRINNRNAAGERYLTALAAMAAADGLGISTVRCEAAECWGVNTAADLERATAYWRQRQAAALLARGVRLADAARVDVRGEVIIAKNAGDIEIDINVLLEGRVTLKAGCRIGAHCVIRDSEIGANTVIEPFSHIEGARIGGDCLIGPFARLRPGTALAGAAKIGNFVEIKESHLAAGVKAGHLSYIGDSQIGENTNIGAGFITCNYDGRRKHKTIIEDNVFIGSDTQLVAPVRVKRGAYIAAGSTITKTVAEQTLAASRIPQTARSLKRIIRKHTDDKGRLL